MAWSTLTVLACVVIYVQAHGRLAHPPNRASLWRVGYNSPVNYDDDGLNCGGFNRQYSVNGGKCGICGDAYDIKQPRPHELGGTYGIGYIVANYEPGQLMTANVYLSTSHLGFWELRICTDPYYQEQECFDNGYLLELEDGGSKYYPLQGSGEYVLNYKLPDDLTCEHCVIQWQYTAGNNWDICANGTGALGCGNQEQFYSCSDISITRSSGSNEITNSHDETDNPVTEAPPKTLIKDLTHEFLNLNPLAIKLLMSGIDLSDYRIFYGDMPVTSSKMTNKKHASKHRRKKDKRKTKRYKKILFWR